MQTTNLDNYQLHIDFIEFQKAILKGLSENNRYCFILGAGASKTSGIPTGIDMVKEWFGALKENKDKNTFKEEIEKRISLIENNNQEDENLIKIKERLSQYTDINYNPNTKDSQDDYNYIYELRFAYDEKEGKKYFLEKSDKAYPNAGYISLASILCNSKNNIVITTNFDELIEMALFIYENKRAFTIEHSSLANFALDDWNDRPRVLKIHQGVSLGGFNKFRETQSLKDEWVQVLTSIFSEYIPIVVGYGGTDNDVMDFMFDVSMRSIYWCYLYGSIPNDKVVELVKCKNGKLVAIYDSDQFFIDMKDVFVNNVESYVNVRDVYDPTRRGAKNVITLHNSKKIVEDSTMKFKERTNELSNKSLKKHSPECNTISLCIFWFALIFNSTYLMKHILQYERNKNRCYYRGYFELGKTYHRKGKYEDACLQYKFLIDDDKCHRYLKCSAQRNLYEIYRIIGDDEECSKLLISILEVEPYDKKCAELLAIR